MAGGARALRSWLRACGGRAFLVDNSARGGNAKANGQAEALLRAVNANLASLAKRRRAESAPGASAETSKAEATPVETSANGGANGSGGSAADDSAGEVGYRMADFKRHAASLTELQRRALAEPQSPEKQAAAATALQGEVSVARPLVYSACLRGGGAVEVGE